jgi:hypothetical protein
LRNLLRRPQRSTISGIRGRSQLSGRKKESCSFTSGIFICRKTFLESNAPYENLIGFWARVKVAPIPSDEDFINDSISPWVKAVWNFQCEKLGENKTKVSTETRVLCVAPITKITFRLYWLMIKPFSGLIRKKMLKIIKNDSETKL